MYIIDIKYTYYISTVLKILIREVFQMSWKRLLILVLCFMCMSVCAVGAYPEPDYPPPSMPAARQEYKTDGKVLQIYTSGLEDVPVVYPDKNSVYHMSGCKVYEDMFGGDYSEPHYLTEIIMDSPRCTECISEETYHMFKENIYILEIEKQEQHIELLSVINLFFALVIIVYAIVRVFKKEKKA